MRRRNIHRNRRYTGTGDINGNAWSYTAPDLRGRTVVAAGTGSGLTARTLGDVVGEEKHKLTEAELAAHRHTSNYDGQQLGSTGNPIYYFTNSAGYFFPQPYGFYINYAGGDQPPQQHAAFLCRYSGYKDAKILPII